MRKWISAILLAAAMLLAPTAHAQDDDCTASGNTERVALIIGNSKYSDLEWPALANATNDAWRLCEAFAKANFRVVMSIDKNADDTRAVLEEFRALAKSADTALVYYAGHGFEYAGSNYIVPIDAPAYASKNELATEFLPMQELMNAAGEAKKFSLFFMDACRTLEPIVQLSDIDPNGVEGGVGSMGLLQLDRGVVFYSTAKGRPAYDDAPEGSPVSPFAAAVSRKIEVPGLELSYFFKVVGRDVYNLTKNMDPEAQYPFPYGTFFDDFYFIPPPDLEAPDTAAEAADEPKIARAARPSQRRVAPARTMPGRTARARTGAVRSSPPPTPAPAAMPAPSPGGSPSTGTGIGPARAGAAPNASMGAGASAGILGFVAPSIIVDAFSNLTMDKLSTVDEPVLVSELLEKYNVSQITLAASGGDPVAQYLLGYMFHFGVGVEKDLDRAKLWLEQSAAQGHPAGQLEYGYFLLQNRIGDDFAENAYDLYQKSAAQDFAKAKSHLGMALWNGNFRVVDRDRAVRLFAEAAEAGHPYGIQALGIYGKQFDAASAQLKKLAAGGNIDANSMLCGLYNYYNRTAEVFDRCEEAARAGFVNSRVITAQSYEKGDGTGPSAKEAIFWARLAIDQPELDGYQCDLMIKLIDRNGGTPVENPVCKQ